MKSWTNVPNTRINIGFRPSNRLLHGVVSYIRMPDKKQLEITSVFACSKCTTACSAILIHPLADPSHSIPSFVRGLERVQHLFASQGCAYDRLRCHRPEPYYLGVCLSQRSSDKAFLIRHYSMGISRLDRTPPWFNATTMINATTILTRKLTKETLRRNFSGR